MSNKLISQLAIIFAVIVGAGLMLYPNFVWYAIPLEQRTLQAKRKNPLARKVIPLGLDLQGGVHLVYEMDTSKLPDESDETVKQAIDQNIVVINNRIDALGVANPFVARQGRNFVVIQMPGVYESEEAKRLIGKTALLEFRLVRQDDTLIKIVQEIESKGIQPEDVINDRLPADIKKMIPEGMDILPVREGGYLLVNAKADLTGKYLKRARVEFGSSGSLGGLSIGFELDADGATLFEALTAAHINERLAIVLDRQIQSAPNIQTRIPGGRGQITGTFSEQEAKSLANVLNSGNLQAPMIVAEERTVGPELGEDSIRSGFKAMAIGFVLVILFMIMYYKLSGALADIALILNLIFLLAIMSWLKATLTMPGIAGIILSLAMAVDANVLILERVREELRKGKDVHMSIDDGYSKAFSAILDGNVTTILAAAFLFQFGTGPVKGFGVTLMWGLIISMVTAVYVTRILYETWFVLFKPKVLSV
ncbi:MAG: protein translocase subunit SecD [Elusimicrobia bacterium]|nr:protein translocase subunit SecD [Candidatus Obscuribacterium magneticum]